MNRYISYIIFSIFFTFSSSANHKTMKDLSDSFSYDAYQCYIRAGVQVKGALLNLISTGNEVNQQGRYETAIDIYKRVLEIGYDWDKRNCYIAKKDNYKMLSTWGHN